MVAPMIPLAQLADEARRGADAAAWAGDLQKATRLDNLERVFRERIRQGEIEECVF